MKTKRDSGNIAYIKRKLLLGIIPVGAIVLIGLVGARFISGENTSSLPLEQITSFDLFLISFFWIGVLFSLLWVVRARMMRHKRKK